MNEKAVRLLLDSVVNDTRSRTLQSLPDARSVKFALSYLDAFGYLKKELEAWNDITLEDIVRAIRLFQNVFGLTQTNTLTTQTVQAMEAPRCGYPDVAREYNARAFGVTRAAGINLPKWQKRGVLYEITDYLPGVAQAEFEEIIQRAFAAWTQHGHITVRRAKTGETPDILISHGAGRPAGFDGRGGILAWAHSPNAAGTQVVAKFDSEETWALKPDQPGVRLYNVACHEFGHLFGLGHSHTMTALMAPYYNVAVAEPQQYDDIPRFQARYASPE